MSEIAELSWRRRSRPLKVVAAFADSSTSLAWARRILAERDTERWRAVAGGRALLLLGPEPPWVDGLVYLGVDAAAPALLLPTLLEPCWPLDLLERALERLPMPLPCAVLPSSKSQPGKPVLMSAHAAQRLDASRLAKWLAEQEIEVP